MADILCLLVTDCIYLIYLKVGIDGIRSMYLLVSYWWHLFNIPVSQLLKANI